MKTGYVARILWALVSLATASFAEAADNVEKSLAAAESKLACCLETASKFSLTSGRKDLDALLKQTQTNWEKYRDTEIEFEMGDVPHSTEAGQEMYANIRLRLTHERIDAIQRAFDYEICNPSEIRVRNLTGTDVKDVIVGNKKYGNLRLNETTAYQHWEVAYQISSVSLIAESKPLKIRLIDMVGEMPLGEGKFTYVLTIRDGTLEMSVEKDSPKNNP